MKIWQKDGLSTSDMILEFTVGNDRVFDVLLARYDVVGSQAHANMLCKVGLLTVNENEQIQAALARIVNLVGDEQFNLPDDAEDIHSYVEELLIKELGDTGKKIHTGRSRNDQVAVDIKLYLRAEITLLKDEVKKLFDCLQTLSTKHADKLIPGYTHMQVGMPSSVGLWLGAYAESLIDDIELLAAAYAVANKNPLGSGAGYGSSFPLDREMTTAQLNFNTLNYNSVYAQMTRGKTEKVTAYAMSSIAATLARLSMDVCLYMGQDFGFITFPDHLTTGSSIMPHKKNPDVFELIRAKCNRIQALPNELTLLLANLPSGYHRDLQLTKEILFPAIEMLKNCIAVMFSTINEVVVKSDVLAQEKYKYLFTVEKINDLVNGGMSFRDAYRVVGGEVNNGTFSYNKSIHHTHEGSIGNLCNDSIQQQMLIVMEKFN